MRQIHGWQQSLAVTPLLSLAVTAFANSSTTSKATAQGIQPSAPELLSFLNKAKYQLAQDPTNCRRVVTKGDDLLVRSSPSGRIIGSLRNRTVVTIENRGADGWVPISFPVKGYVSSTYLKLCAEPVPPSQAEIPSDNYIRRVAAINGLIVRQDPSPNSPIVGSLADGQRVKIASRGANGWVPLLSPIQGYVSSAYLKENF